MLALLRDARVRFLYKRGPPRDIKQAKGKHAVCESLHAVYKGELYYNLMWAPSLDYNLRQSLLRTVQLPNLHNNIHKGFKRQTFT